MMQALREILLNAMEHGAAFNPEQVLKSRRSHCKSHGVLHTRSRCWFPPRIAQPCGDCKSG